MRFFINARFLTQRPSGVQRYARELLTALDPLIEPGQAVAFTPEGVKEWPDWQNIAIKVLPRNSGHFWDQTTLFHAARNGVLLSLGNSGPLRHSRQVLALHDANIWEIPDAFSMRYRMLHKTMRPMLARRATQLLTVSAFSAQKLRRYLRISPDQFEIVPNGADHICRLHPDCHILSNHGLRQGHYFLCVGNQSPNKNLGRLVSAHAAAGSTMPPLVVAGDTAPGLAGIRSSTSARVIRLGRVSDAELRALYEGAKAFVFPSLYEGFGIPPLEAMMLGTPVLCAHRSAMKDNLGDAPIWFDPTDVSAITQALHQMVSLSDADRQARIELGRHIAARFTWSRSAAQVLDILHHVAGAEAKPGRVVPPNDRERMRRSV